MVSQADARHLFLLSALQQMRLAESAAKSRLELSPRGLPAGLGIPPPPGLSLAPPPGLELPSEATRGCSRAGSKWGSDCSTADSCEAASIPSPASPSPAHTPRGAERPAALDEIWYVRELEGMVAVGPRVFEEPERVLRQAARSQQAMAGRPRAGLHETTAGAPGCPSVGSRGHFAGHCKPCDFTFRTGGCREGAACKFCHLCGPEASRRRKKERRQILQTAGQWA